MSYAVIQSGGKQYRVSPGDFIQLELLSGEAGTPVRFDEVLFFSKPEGEAAKIWLGKPLLSGAKVEGKIVGQGRGEKILIIKKNRRKQYKRTKGHRQELTQILITGIENGSGEKLALSKEEETTKMKTFFSNLKPKGLGYTPKTLGSRERMKRQAVKTPEATAAAAPAKTAAKKKASK